MPKFIFLGTGDSRGTPRLYCTCEVCASSDPKNRRFRPSAIFETDDGHALLLDISPDIRYQLLATGIPMDAVSVALVTHPHHDHIGGMGDYADLFFWSKRDATIISTENVIKIMQERYPYLNNGRNIYYKATDTFDFHGWKICFKEVNHGRNGTANGIFFLKRRSAGCLCS